MSLWPQLPESVPVRVAQAYLGFLRDDPALGQILTGIDDSEAEGVLDNASVQAPYLGLVLSGQEHRLTSGPGSELRVDLDLLLLTRPAKGTDTQGFARARLADHILAVVMANREVFDQGRQLVMAIERLRRLDYSTPLKASGLMLTQIRVTTLTDHDEAAREILP